MLEAVLRRFAFTRWLHVPNLLTLTLVGVVACELLDDDVEVHLGSDTMRESSVSGGYVGLLEVVRKRED
jgi:hypothetical protein